MYFIVYDPSTGENIGPFSRVEDAVEFINFCAQQMLAGWELLEVQEMTHPQQFVLDNNIEERKEELV